MQKTQNYNLNKPDPTDPIRIADLNANADAIDTALSEKDTQIAALQTALAAAPKIAVGSYAGNGATSRTISLGFRPKAVIAWGVYFDTGRTVTSSYNAMALDGSGFNEVLTVVDSGFTAGNYNSSLSGQYYPSLNSSGMTYLYLAIG